LPNPPEPVKQQIIAEIESIEKHDEQEIAKIAQINAEIKAKINALYENFAARVKVKPFFDINTKSISPAQIYGETLFTYVDIDSVGKGNGSISFSQKIKGVNAPSRAKRIADDKTVIISTVRPNLKGFAFAEKVPADTVFSTGFALIKSKDEKKYKSKLLYYLFMFSDDLMEQMKAKMPKASYPSINQNDIEGFAIPEIEITAQQDVVTFISKLESEIFEQQRLIQDSESEKQAILRKYLD
jgi:restriction endonuclease S subunit